MVGLLPNEQAAAESMSQMILLQPVENWFLPVNLRRLADIQHFPSAWMPVYIAAKQQRIEVELATKIEEHVALGRISGLVHWLDLPDIDPDCWLMDRLIRKGSLSILAGAPKVGKSTMIAHFITCLLTGTAFIDRETKPTTVVYYALEEIGAEVKGRFQAYGLKDEPLYVREGYVPPSHFLDIMSEDIAETQAQFVLIDPLFDILSVQSANDYTPVNRAMKGLLHVARTTGAHIMCIHHSAKGTTSILGAQSLRGSTDCNIYMDLNDKNERIVYSENRYGAPLEKYFVKMREDSTLYFQHTLL